jgi:hypothetical protein
MHLSASTRHLTARALANGFGVKEFVRNFAGNQAKINNAQLRTGVTPVNPQF